MVEEVLIVSECSGGSSKCISCSCFCDTVIVIFLFECTFVYFGEREEFAFYWCFIAVHVDF